MKNKAALVSSNIKNTVSTPWFFWLIIAIALIQCVWYAATVSSVLFDEQIHIGITKVYSSQESAFLESQPAEWDNLGELTRNSNYLFYYVMSYPYRLLDVFGATSFAILVFLRFLCVGFFIAALFLFRRAFIDAGFSRALTHTALLLFIMVPTVIPLAATFNYDNVIFFLFALIVLLAFRCLRPNANLLVLVPLLISICMIGSIIKFTFIVLSFVVLALVSAVLLVQKRKTIRYSKIVTGLKNDYKRTRKLVLLPIAAFVLLSSFLFIERPVQNLVTHGKLEPTCKSILTEQRCAANITAKRNQELAARPFDRSKILDHFTYFYRLWLPLMITGTVSISLIIGQTHPMYVLANVGLIVGIAAVVYYLHKLRKDKSFVLLLAIVLGFSLILYEYLYRQYLVYGAPVAVSARYLIPILPIGLLLTLRAFNENRYLRRYAGLLLISLALLFTQGGGLLTFLAQAPDSIYNQDSLFISTVEPLQYIARKIIIGS